MSAPSDVNVRVRFTANTAQIKQMFTQMRKLQNTVKALGKNVSKLGSDMKKLGSRFDTTNSKVKKINKGFQSQAQKVDRARSSVKKLTSAQRGYGSATDKMTRSNKKGNTSLGFTGLAFGFIGGIAGFAATQIRTQFIRALEDTATLMSEISRINLFSDVGIANGVVNITALEAQTKKVFDLARETGILTSDVATIIKEVEKAAPFSLDTEVFAKLVVEMKLLENTLNASTIAADIITIQSNFEELTLEELIDEIFAFGKANKLTFSASAKAIGFAAQNTKLLGGTLTELNTIMTVVANKIPGFQGNAGRAIRRLTTAFQDPTTIQNLRNLGIHLVNSQGRFIGLSAAMDIVASKFNTFNDINQEMGSQFLKLIGLSENARLALLAYADASPEVRAAAAKQFENIQGNFQVAVDFQKTQPEAVLGIFKNQITELKVAFTSGLFPAISQVNDALKEAFAGGELISVLKEFGNTIGKDIVAAANVFIPIIRTIASILSIATPIVQLLAKATTGLFLALSTITVVFPILGFFFALIFLHEKLITRSVQLGTSATFVTKSYVRLTAVMTGLNLRFKAWLVQLRAGNLSMGILSKQGTGNLIKSLARLGVSIKLQILSWKVFTIAATQAAFAAARAWIIALLPLAVALALFIGLIFLAKRYEDSLVSLADQLDTTGKAGENISNAIFQLDQLLQGNAQPFFQPLLDDLDAAGKAIGNVGSAFGIFFADLGKSEIFQGFVRGWEKLMTNIDNVIVGIDEFINGLIFSIPDAWNAFLQFLFDIWNTAATAKLKLDLFIESLDLDENPVWQKLQEIFQGIIDILDPILRPLNAFIDALDFPFPDVLTQIKNTLDDIAKNPLIAGGIRAFKEVSEIGGIISNLITNAGKPEEEQKSFFPGPFDLLDPDTRISGIPTFVTDFLNKVRDEDFVPELSDFDKGLAGIKGNFPVRLKTKAQLKRESEEREARGFIPQLDLRQQFADLDIPDFIEIDIVVDKFIIGDIGEAIAPALKGITIPVGFDIATGRSAGLQAIDESLDSVKATLKSFIDSLSFIPPAGLINLEDNVFGIIELFRDAKTDVVAFIDNLEFKLPSGFKNLEGNLNGILDLYRLGKNTVNEFIANLSFKIPTEWDDYKDLVSVTNDVVFETGQSIVQFIDDLEFEIPTNWFSLDNLATSIHNTLLGLAAPILLFVESLGFDLPEEYSLLDKTTTAIKDTFDLILSPIQSFIDILDFELPEPLLQLQGIIQGIANAFRDLIALLANNPLAFLGIGTPEVSNKAPKEKVASSVQNVDFKQIQLDVGQTAAEIDISEADSINKELESFAKSIAENNKKAQDTFEKNFGSSSNFANPDFGAPAEQITNPSGRGPELDQLLRDAGFDPEAIAAAGEKFRGPQSELDLATKNFTIDSRPNEQGGVDTNVNLGETLSFGLPPEIQEAMVETTDTFIRTLDATNIAFEATNIALGNSALLLEEGEEAITDNATALLANAGIVKVSTVQTGTQIQRQFDQIVEIIRNTNITSALTTKIAEVILVFTRLAAEGNRAAGKLASLRVSTSGKFSITDPGISSSDQAAIAAAAADLAATKANQVNIAIPTAPDIGTQNNNIVINPSIVINNAEGLDTEQLVDLINIEFAKTLQKNISQIITV